MIRWQTRGRQNLLCRFRKWEVWGWPCPPLTIKYVTQTEESKLLVSHKRFEGVPLGYGGDHFLVGGTLGDVSPMCSEMTKTENIPTTPLVSNAASNANSLSYPCSSHLCTWSSQTPSDCLFSLQYSATRGWCHSGHCASSAWLSTGRFSQYLAL